RAWVIMDAVDRALGQGDIAAEVLVTGRGYAREPDRVAREHRLDLAPEEGERSLGERRDDRPDTAHHGRGLREVGERVAGVDLGDELHVVGLEPEDEREDVGEPASV